MTDFVLRAAGRAVGMGIDPGPFLAMLSNDRKADLLAMLLAERIRAEPGQETEAIRTFLKGDTDGEVEFGIHEDKKHFVLAICDNAECLTCGAALCPHYEPMHLHHDGCPACAEALPIGQAPEHLDSENVEVDSHFVRRCFCGDTLDTLAEQIVGRCDGCVPM